MARGFGNNPRNAFERAQKSLLQQWQGALKYLKEEPGYRPCTISLGKVLKQGDERILVALVEWFNKKYSNLEVSPSDVSGSLAIHICRRTSETK